MTEPVRDLGPWVIGGEASLRDAMERIDDNQMGFLVVVDAASQVLGVVTDGDLRRALLRGRELTDGLDSAYGGEPAVVTVHADMATVAELLKDQRIRFLPVVNDDGVLVNIITRSQFHAYLLNAGTFSATVDFLALDPVEEDQHIHPRPWGFYKTVFFNQHTRGKIICVYPGQELSLQYHHHREEHWMVVSGAGRVTLAASTRALKPGDYVFVPLECPHRLANTSNDEVLMVTEVQLGESFDEEDIVRLSDHYDRVPGSPE